MPRKSSYKKSRRLITPGGALIMAVGVLVVLVIAMLKSWGQQTEPVHIDPQTDLTYVAQDAATPAVDIQYTGFRVNFNPELHIPNYVVWTLERTETDGPHTRKNANFQADVSVAGSAVPEDYKRSGFDRGHMAPAADMKWSREAMSDCHYLTNICPQDKALNAGAWASVEKMCRNWANKYGRVIIVCGPVTTDYMTRAIGSTRVAVPERFFKVVIAPDAVSPKGIGFLMSNSPIEGGAQSAVVSIDQVEAVTGLDFFSALPDDIENAIEAQASLQDWQRGK